MDVIMDAKVDVLTFAVLVVLLTAQQLVVHLVIKPVVHHVREIVMEDALWDVDQDVTDVMVAADADHVQDLVVLLVLDVHRAPVVRVAQDVVDLALVIVGHLVPMDVPLVVLKTAEVVEQDVRVAVEVTALEVAEAIVQEDAVMAARQVVEEVVRVVVPVVRAAMVLVLDHVDQLVQGNVEGVVIIVLQVVLLIVVLRVLELAMVAFQIQFNKLI